MRLGKAGGMCQTSYEVSVSSEYKGETMNCWEFKKCGREKGGAKASLLGVCPAYPDHGKHCARICGTLCGGLVQGSFALKLASCMKCEFYKSPQYDRTYRQ